MNTEGKTIWKILSVCSFIGSTIAIYLGFDKMLNYVNSEYAWAEPHNAYVGGDAYNYIINGNYSTGFFVLATMFALMGVGFIVVYYLSKIANTEEESITYSQMIHRSIQNSKEKNDVDGNK